MFHTLELLIKAVFPCLRTILDTSPLFHKVDSNLRSNRVEEVERSLSLRSTVVREAPHTVPGLIYSPVYPARLALLHLLCRNQLSSDRVVIQSSQFRPRPIWLLLRYHTYYTRNMSNVFEFLTAINEVQSRKRFFKKNLLVCSALPFYGVLQTHANDGRRDGFF